MTESVTESVCVCVCETCVVVTCVIVCACVHAQASVTENIHGILCLCVSMMYAVFCVFDSVFVSQEKKRKKNERWVKRVMWRRKF